MPDSGGKTITRMFESGDFQTLRIPRELAYDESVQEVEIERKGDMLQIRPIHRKNSLASVQCFRCSALTSWQVGAS